MVRGEGIYGRDFSKRYRRDIVPARLGSGKAQRDLGMMYLRGYGTHADYETAYHWLSKALDRDTDGCLGMHALAGLLSNHLRASEAHNEAMKGTFEDDPFSYYTVGRIREMFRRRKETRYDAVLYYQAAMDKGVAEAYGSLANMYLDDPELCSDMDVVEDILEHGVRMGDPQSMCLLAKTLNNGLFGHYDHPRAERLLKKASDMVYPGADIRLAERYVLDGRYDDAVVAYERAYARGNTAAMKRLGILYLNGTISDPDHSGALRCFRRSLDDGDTEAPYYLGRMYYGGIGVEKDPSTALKYFLMGSEHDENNSMKMLSVCLEKGQGCIRSSAASEDMLIRTGRNGDVESMGILWKRKVSDALPDEKGLKDWFRRNYDRNPFRFDDEDE